MSDYSELKRLADEMLEPSLFLHDESQLERQRIGRDLLALIDDNERLKTVVYAVHGAGVAELHEQISKLKAENEALRKDTERYRYIRLNGYRDVDTDEWSGMGESMDAFIDDYMAQEAT